ncbi:chloride channel protein [Alkaliphilus transvaalensis]|uniref:chloride channel protein n=1 Tax=Alkaliphilus transvaalensis TaxID=114628 RepID=UPI001FA7ED29|nr:chloride channel protein [Alkaliphilus transvaalensis]
MTKWLTIATFAGIGGGLSAVVLSRFINWVGIYGGRFPLWIAPAIGGVIVSIIYLYDRDASGFGTDHYICAVNTKHGHLSFKTLYSKLAATAVTLGFKGSGGVEGPMLVIGGSLADGISRLPILRKYISEHEHHVLTICGAAGAIGAIFRSPLGGGIFVVEVLYHSSLHYSDLFPAILSSIMGFVIYGMLKDPTPLFKIPDYLPNVFNVPLFVLAAIVAGVASLLFMAIFGYIKAYFDKSPYKKIHPIIGGLLTGLIILFLPETAGTGTNIIQNMINENFPITLLMLLFIGKIFATSFTVGSGGSAGLVIPALFIGAIAGNSVSTLIGATDVGLSASLVIAGMAASLASIANVPIAAAIMLVEMVGLRLGVPAALGSIIGYAIGHSRVIYGVTCPDHWQFEQNVEIKASDKKLDSH